MTTHTLAWFGNVTLLLTLLGCAYAIGSAWFGVRTGKMGWIHSSRYATYTSCALLSLVSTLIWFALISNDFSIRYVFHNSELEMPWFYKLTAYWGGLDGSLLFWAWILSLCTTLSVHWNYKRHPDLIPWVLIVLMGLLAFFVSLLIFFKRPFAVFLAQVPIQGKGLTPLLQDPYMAIHPPSLYVGYVSASVPFAFGVAALITGRLDDTWLASVRKWMLVCWYFLAQGLILGALWAYHVLGWGGYWGWDPVENAGLLPWLTATAFLHSMMIQERRGMLKTWNVVLVVLTFLLTLLGTFLTRSGIVMSVHAFGKDPEMTGTFLALIGLCALLGFGLILYRLPQLQNRNELESWKSREFFFLLNNWVLLGMAFFVLILTLFPTLAEAFWNERITVGPPVFNRWMPLFGLLLLALMGVAPLVPWRQSSLARFWQQVRWPVVAGSVGTLGVALLFPASRTRSMFLHTQWKVPISLLCIALVLVALVGISQEFYHGLRARRKNHPYENWIISYISLVLRNKRRYGGYWIHVGIALMFFGFAGQPFGQDHDVTLFQGQTTQVGPYTLRYEQVTQRQDATKERIQEAKVQVQEGNHALGTLHPARWTYRKRTDEPPRTIVQIRSSLRDDIYLILTGYDETSGQASFKVLINPLVFWLWFGFAVLVFGTAIVILPDSQEESTPASLSLAKPSTALVALVVLFTGICFSPQILHAQTASSSFTHTEGTHLPQPPRSNVEKQLRQQLLCMCGCGKQTLADCTCGHASKERDRIASLLDQGKTTTEIIADFVERYHSEAVLSTPPDRKTTRIMWVFPLGLFVMAGLVLVRRARKIRRRKTKTPSLKTNWGTSSAEPYQQRLDAELAEEDR